MRKNLFVVFATILAVMSVFTAHSSERTMAGDGVFQVLDKEQLIHKWNDFLQEMGTMEGTLSCAYWRNGIKDEKDSYSMNFFYNFPYIAKEGISNDGIMSAGVRAGNYVFLVKSENKQNLNWVVDKLDKATQTGFDTPLSYPDISVAAPESGSGNINGICAGICNSLCVLMIEQNLFLPSLMNQEEFSITGNEIVNVEGSKQFQRLRFKFYTDNSSKYPNFVFDNLPFSIEGDLMLETEYRLIGKGTIVIVCGTEKETVVIDCVYDKNTLPVPMLVTYTAVRELPNGSTFREVHSFEKLKKCTADTSRFTLSHYGLPEPDFGESRANRIRYVIMSLGVLLIVIGLWRMYKKRQEHNV
jgi:hypothetical protein